MLIDDVTIQVIAGDGGDGSVAFNKNLKELGPAGASGGNGGSVYCTGVADIGALTHWRNTKTAIAPDGEVGGVQYRDGKDGVDFEFFVPVGTVIHNLDTKESQEITAIGQRVLLAHGGRGGRGNYHFRSSTNTSPKQSGRGTVGQRWHMRLELAHRRCRPCRPSQRRKIQSHQRADPRPTENRHYPFTTLEPGLGVLRTILADIPGIIEGASSGKGLGIKFLRHVERTRTLLHLISCETEDPVRDWRVIRAELGAYNPALLQKEEHVLLTKTDLVDTTTVARMVKQFRTEGIKAIPFSIHDSEAIASLEVIFRKLIAAKKVVQP